MGDVEESRQAGVLITPEMLEAGGLIVEAWEYGYPSSELLLTHRDLAKSVYLASKRCEPQLEPLTRPGIPGRDFRSQ